MEYGLTIKEIHDVYDELEKKLGPRQLLTACLFHNICVQKIEQKREGKYRIMEFIEDKAVEWKERFGGPYRSEVIDNFIAFLNKNDK